MVSLVPKGNVMDTAKSHTFPLPLLAVTHQQLMLGKRTLQLYIWGYLIVYSGFPVSPLLFSFSGSHGYVEDDQCWTYSNFTIQDRKLHSLDN